MSVLLELIYRIKATMNIIPKGTWQDDSKFYVEEQKTNNLDAPGKKKKKLGKCALSYGRTYFRPYKIKYKLIIDIFRSSINMSHLFCPTSMSAAPQHETFFPVCLIFSSSSKSGLVSLLSLFLLFFLLLIYTLHLSTNPWAGIA